MTIESFKMHRGVCRMYSILLYKDAELESNMTAPKFRMQVSTGFVIKVGKRKYVVSNLSLVQVPSDLLKMPESK